MEKKEVELPGYIQVSAQRDAKVEAEIQRHRGYFITERLDQKRRELGVKEFKKQRGNLIKEFEQAWKQRQETSSALRELEDQMRRKIMKWAPLEKLYRLKLEAEGWPKNVIEKTIITRRKDFERAQRIVQGRLRSKIDPGEDFKHRVLNPETRREAIKKYLIDHVNKAHFQMEAFNLIFEELDKRKRG
jgi:hypothetical protein